MKQLFTLFSLMFSLATLAQNAPARITGTVVDGSAKTLESATIALLSAKDSSTVKFAVATKTGQFIFEQVAPGNYLVMVSAVGHIKGFSELIRIDASTGEVKTKTIELIRNQKPWERW